jgi:hypothetical protein
MNFEAGRLAVADGPQDVGEQMSRNGGLNLLEVWCIPRTEAEREFPL